MVVVVVALGGLAVVGCLDVLVDCSYQMLVGGLVYMVGVWSYLLLYIEADVHGYC